MTSAQERAENVAEVIEDKPEYEDLLEDIVTWHEEDYKAVKGYRGDGIYATQAPVHPNRLQHLVNNGILTVTTDTNSVTIYQPTEWVCPECDHLNGRRLNPEPTDVECQLCHETFSEKDVEPSVKAIREGLKLVEKGGVEAAAAKEFSPDVDVDGLFDPIIGYDEIKHRFQRSIKSRSIRQSIMLVGPRASAKTLFLREVTRIENTARISGSSLTPAGLEDVIMERPSYIIIDEFDEVQDPGIYSVLMNYQDATMPYSITKSGKQDEISVEAKAPVFVSANDTARIPEPNMDRFWDYYFEGYDADEFREICVNILPERFDIRDDLAGYIADRLREWSPDASVRDAERVAEVVSTEADVDEEIRILEEYDQ